MILRVGYTADGFYLRLADDTAKTGGYYLLLSKGSEGYDEWYERLSDAERRFDELVIPAASADMIVGE